MQDSPPATVVSEVFARRFTARAADSGGTLTFAAFMELALYDPEVGYYRAERTRVGRTGTADFYTASSFGPVFGTLVAAAATTLLGNGIVGEHMFVEIGAEPGRCVLDGVSHRFRATRSIRLGEPITLEGPLVVFSNELFDAQPFHRVVFREEAWHELGVSLAGRELAWIELPHFSPPVVAIADRLPATADQGYTLDLPLASVELARRIAAPTWEGLFLAFDYGRTWTQLLTEYPAGTGRAYANHRQSGDLLAQPGAQDLTCHVCWDWLENTLQDAGFGAPSRESQEAFFVRRATAAIERIIAGDPSPLSPARTRLRHLLHPGLMGQRFEALWALRRSEAIRR